MSDPDVSIRKISDADLQALREVCIQTFSETFAEKNTQEDLDNYFNKEASIEQLKSELNNTESEFYFAEFENMPVGYLKINTGQAQTEQLLEKSLEVQRIYVLNEYQGKKIGKLFFEKALQLTKELNLERVWLGVWEENRKAIKFYQRQGFEKFAEHPFVLGDKVDNDWLMKLELTEVV